MATQPTQPIGGVGSQPPKKPGGPQPPTPATTEPEQEAIMDGEFELTKASADADVPEIEDES